MITALLRSFFTRSQAPVKDARLEHLYSPATLQDLLLRERARVDRCGGALSLIVLASPDNWSQSVVLYQLAETLRRRLRLTDFAGWLDDGRIAVVLPLTTSTGAWRVADDLIRHLEGDSCLPICRVYSYPTQWFSGQQEPVSTTHNDQGQPVLPAESLLIEPLPAWKRGIDLLGACVGLALLSPVMLVVAGAVRVSSPGPILFRQQRSGRGGKPFTMMKFRSMVVDAEVRKKDLMALNEQDGPAFKITHDPRVTRLGHFLRSTSLDELPQLWNVFKGEMSLVGPRPLPISESEACSTWQKRRLDVTPGITCIWQCQGGQRVTFDEWMRMDIRYVRNRSLLFDLGLVFKTIFAVISRKALKHN